MMFSSSRAGYSARLQSSYMNTTNKCLELFYVTSSSNQMTSLSIKTISEELDVTVVVSKFTIVSEWTRLFVPLTPGVNRVSIEGLRDVGGSTVKIDDVLIQDCQQFGKQTHV